MRVGLFVTCLVDLMRPSIGFAALKLLEEAGCEVVVPLEQTCCGQPGYNSGDRPAAQALALLGRWKPDVLVSDIGMPGEDGFALMRQIEARDDHEAGQPLAIALTAYTSIEDRVRLFSAGFQAHVSKPLDPAELLAVVSSLARGAEKLR